MQWLTKLVDRLGKVGVFSGWLNIAGVITLSVMVLLTCIDVILRAFFNSPIHGVYEYTSVMLILVVFLGVAYTHYQKGHVRIDIIAGYLPAKGNTGLSISTTLICIGVAAIMVWRSIVQFLYFVSNHSLHSPNTDLISAPFEAVIIVGCALLLLLLIRDLFEYIGDGMKHGFKAYQWAVVFGIPILFLVFSYFWMQPSLWTLNGPAVGVLGIVASLIFMLSGMPIAFAMILASVLFIGNIQGLGNVLSLLGTELYRTTSTYSWSVIPFFIFMGYLCLEAGFGKDLYTLAYRWLGRLSGGLAIATVGACTVFAAIVGSGLAPTATMGTVSLPEMRRYKYDDRLAAGSIVAGASLGPIIPPSTPLIIYAILTQQSVGKLFVAGILPGILMAILFCLWIYIRCRISPDFGPRGEEKFSLSEKMASLKGGLPVILLFVLVIGGVYAGIFSATEAGAVGCAITFIIALIMRRLTWKNFKNALLAAGKTTAMTFLLLISGILIGRLISFTNLPAIVTTFIQGLEVNNVVIVTIILAIFFFLGFFVEIMPLMLVGVPIVHPLVTALGYDPIWFTLMLTITVGIGTISPPVGINLFTLKAVAPHINMGAIYRGALPFVLVTVVALVILFIFPAIITWLPGILK